jgi:hypothetical protein
VTRILKYVIDVGPNKLDIPLGAEILTIQLQSARFTVWARVHEDSPRRPRGLYLAMTGEDLSRCEATHWDYKGTVQDGAFVFHLLAEPS